MRTPTLHALLILLVVTLINVTHQNAFAQQTASDSTLVRVETSDGNAYVGRIVAESNESIKLKTDNLGEITIQKINIHRITPIANAQVKNGVAWFENPQATRYFLQPNGYGLKRGEAYYQNVWIFFNQVTLGVSDNFSIGTGLVPLFLFGSESGTPVWITPKFSVPIVKDKVNVGAGALVGTLVGEEEGGFGIVYGVTTLGSRDKNCSIGFGWAYAAGDFADSPTITFSGLIRTGARGYFMTENYYINTADDPLVLLSLGGRRIANRTGIDFGLFIPVSNELDTFVAIPWLGVSAPLNKKSTPTRKR